MLCDQLEVVDSFADYYGAGELAACKGTDIDGAVASSEQPLSSGDAAGALQKRAGHDVDGAGAADGVPAAGNGGGTPVPGGERLYHEPRWQFIQVGRYIERASATASLLEAYHKDLWGEGSAEKPEGNEYLDWMGLLRSATAFEAYCKVYTADLTPERILEFLLLDPDFPHSLRFSIDALQAALMAIDRTSGGSRAQGLSRLAGRLQASLA